MRFLQTFASTSGAPAPSSAGFGEAAETGRSEALRIVTIGELQARDDAIPHERDPHAVERGHGHDARAAPREEHLVRRQQV